MATRNQDDVHYEKDDEMSEDSDYNSSKEKKNATGNEKIFFSCQGDELSVTFCQANLKTMSDSTGQYCRLKVGAIEEITSNSESRKPSNPTWAEQKKCTLMAGISYIFIEVFEKNFFRPDMKIACTFISIDQIREKGNEKSDWYPLSSLQGVDDRGELQLITSYTSKTTTTEESLQPKFSSTDSTFVYQPSYFHGHYLKVGCMQAKLKQQYGIFTMDPYCVLKLGSVVFQTKKSCSANPRWGDKATLQIEHGAKSLFVEIFDKNTLPKDTKIAWASFPIEELLLESGKEKTSWYPLSGNQGTNKEGVILLSSVLEIESVEEKTKNDAPEIVHNVPRELEQNEMTRINVLLLGDTRFDKAFLGNAIMDREASCFCEKTETTQIETIARENWEINLINTGDLFSPQQRMRNDEVVLETAKLAIDFPDGIHVFLISSKGNISEELGKILIQLEKTYGSSLYDHCVLLVRNQRTPAPGDPLRSFVTQRSYFLSNHIIGKTVTSLNDSCLKEVVDDILEVNRLNKGEPVSNQYFDTARQQRFEKNNRTSNMKFVLEYIFKHISDTTCNQKVSAIKQMLNDKKLEEINRLVELSRDEKFDLDVGAIRSCTEWCVDDLETFINISLTKHMLSNFCKSDETVQRFDRNMKLPLEKALQDAIQMKAGRMEIIEKFHNDVEKRVRDFMRQTKLLEFQNIRRQVDNGIIREDLQNAISESVHEEYCKPWEDMVKNLSLRLMKQYFQIVQACCQVKAFFWFWSNY